MVSKIIPTKRCTLIEKYRLHLPPYLRMVKCNLDIRPIKIAWDAYNTTKWNS